MLEKLSPIAAAVLAASLLWAPPGAAAQSRSPEQKAAAEAVRDACRSDYDRFCASVRPGGGRILQCLESHAGDLVPACRTALEKARSLRRTTE